MNYMYEDSEVLFFSFIVNLSRLEFAINAHNGMFNALSICTNNLNLFSLFDLGFIAIQQLQNASTSTTIPPS